VAATLSLARADRRLAGCSPRRFLKPLKKHSNEKTRLTAQLRVLVGTNAELRERADLLRQYGVLLDGEGLEGLAAQIEILRRAVMALRLSLAGTD
jgi:hypothetical protein